MDDQEKNIADRTVFGGILTAEGVVLVKLLHDGKASFAPLTQALADIIGITHPDILKLIAKQEKAAQALIDSGKLMDPRWLQKHVRVVGPKDVVNGFSAKLFENLQESLKHPTAQKRIANALVNPQGRGIMTYRIVKPEKMGFDVGGTGDPYTTVQKVRQDLISDDFWNFTDSHETTHEGQLRPARLNAREGAVYEDVIEAHARIEQYCNGVLEGRNPEGLGPRHCKNLTTILEEIDPKLSWDDFLKLQKTDPHKFNVYMKRIKELSFIDIMEKLPTTALYTKQFLSAAWWSKGKGSIETLKEVVQYYAKQMDVDFNAIWPTVEGYATGKVKIPNLNECFDSDGKYVRAVAKKRLIEARFKTAKDVLAGARFRFPEDKKALRPYVQEYEKAAVAYALSMDDPFINEVHRLRGSKWIAEHFDELMDFKNSARTSCIVQDNVLGPLYRVQLANGGDVAFFDTEGRLRRYHDFDRETVTHFDASGASATVVDAKGKPIKVIHYDVNGTLSTGVDAKSKLAQEVYPWRLKDDYKDYYQKFQTYRSLQEGWDNVAKKAVKEVPSVTPSPSPKGQVVRGAVQLVGRAGAVMGAGYISSRYSKWKVQKENGTLLGITPDGESLALQKAQTLLGTGGVVLAGTTAALLLGGAKIAGSKAGIVAAKTVPVVGTVLGCGYGIVRACKGDWTGAGMEFASAGLDIVSGLGVAASATGVGAIGGVPLSTWAMSASLALDTTLAIRDGLRVTDGVNAFALVDEQGKPVMQKDENGRKAQAIGAKITYKNGLKNGDALFYDLASDGQVKPIAYGLYVKDKKEGRWEIYDEQGHVREILNYKNGELCGEYQRLDENGDLLAYGEFPSGEYEEYCLDENGHSTGIVRKSGKFENGRQVGEWYILGEDGQEYRYDISSDQKPEDVNVIIEDEHRRFNGKAPRNAREAAEQNGYFGHHAGGVDDLVAQRAEGGRGVQAKRGAQRRMEHEMHPGRQTARQQRKRA